MASITGRIENQRPDPTGSLLAPWLKAKTAGREGTNARTKTRSEPDGSEKKTSKT